VRAVLALLKLMRYHGMRDDSLGKRLQGRRPIVADGD